MGMISTPLTIIDSPVQLDGAPGNAWTWAAPELGCPLLDAIHHHEPAADAGIRASEISEALGGLTLSQRIAAMIGEAPEQAKLPKEPEA